MIVIVRHTGGRIPCKHNIAVQYLDMLVLRLMDRIAYKIADHLEREGHPSFVTAAQETDWNLKQRATEGSDPTPAKRASGRLGFVNILSPEFGPRLYLTGILTEIELSRHAYDGASVSVSPVPVVCIRPTDAVSASVSIKRNCAV